MPAVEWHAFLEELLGGEGMVYSGHAGVRDFFREFGESFDQLYWEYPDVRDLGDRLLAIGTFRARGRGSGIEAEVPLGVVVTFEDGLVSVVWSTDDPDEALKLAGLSEWLRQMLWTKSGVLAVQHTVGREILLG